MQLELFNGMLDEIPLRSPTRDGHAHAPPDGYSTSCRRPSRRGWPDRQREGRRSERRPADKATPDFFSASARETTAAISLVAASGDLPAGCTPQIAVVAERSSDVLHRPSPRSSRPYVMYADNVFRPVPGRSPTRCTMTSAFTRPPISYPTRTLPFSTTMSVSER